MVVEDVEELETLFVLCISCCVCYVILIKRSLSIRLPPSKNNTLMLTGSFKIPTTGKGEKCNDIR